MTLSLDPRTPEPTGEPKSVEPAPSPEVTRSSRSLRRWIGLIPAGIVVLIALVGPLLVPYSTRDVVAKPDISPGGDHWFGTDSSGLDVFSRTIAATQNDVLIGLGTAIVATIVGITIGLIIGMNESRSGVIGILSRGMARAVDLVQAVPAIVIGLVLIAFFGQSILSITVALTVVLLPNQARLVRTEVLRVRGEAYLDAARVSGESELSLVFRHVLPNSAWPALENASLVFGSAIVLTAGLGFLGVGLAPPTPEWGTMISTGAAAAAAGRWWSALFPAIAIALTVFAITAVGRRLFDNDN
ncbi:ABC transporter permease [Rhodococcoides yunnanense]|uniref:ABC transporter permease n=1 Tax=Rhodococcoides yunnanense TaxID=278209 RepID=UPI000A058405|nr:ABC transporter permease [Rhodococcus yunnanensis]